MPPDLQLAPELSLRECSASQKQASYRQVQMGKQQTSSAEIQQTSCVLEFAAGSALRGTARTGSPASGRQCSGRGTGAKQRTHADGQGMGCMSSTTTLPRPSGGWARPEEGRPAVGWLLLGVAELHLLQVVQRQRVRAPGAQGLACVQAHIRLFSTAQGLPTKAAHSPHSCLFPCPSKALHCRMRQELHASSPQLSGLSHLLRQQ